jgi:hypothetical protein
MKKALFGLFLISTSMIMFTGQSASALSPANPSCISALQSIKEANNLGVSPLKIRQYLDEYKKICSDGVEYTEVKSTTALSPAHPSCISFLQTINEANRVRVSGSVIRSALDTYKQNCSTGVESTEVGNTPKSRPVVEKMVDGVLTITNEGF